MAFLHYSLTGKTSSPTCLVFIHGMLGNQSHWALQKSYFETQYQVLSFDLPGHGQSLPKPDQKWDVVNLARDIQEFLTALNLQKQMIIIAHSAAVRIALELNYLLAGGVVGLVLLDCGYQASAYPDVKQLSADIQYKGYIGWLTQLFSIRFGSHTPQRLRDSILQTASILAPEMGEALYLALIVYDYYAVEKCLRLTKVPVLVMQSSFYVAGKSQTAQNAEDVRSEWLNLIKSTLPTAQIQILLHCGHWMMLEQPQVCNEQIERFIALCGVG